MKLCAAGLSVLLLLWTASCEQVDRKDAGPETQVMRQGIAVRDLSLENQKLDKEIRQLRKELEDAHKAAEAGRSDVEKLVKEKEKLAEQQSASQLQIEKLKKENEQQALTLYSSAQTSDRLSRENERLRKEIDQLREQLTATQEENIPDKKPAPAPKATPE